MTQEEKQLLIQDICARLPYGVMCQCIDNNFTPQAIDYELVSVNLQDETVIVSNSVWNNEFHIEYVKPYLRLKSSMTEKEKKELRKLICFDYSPKDCPIVERDFSVILDYSCSEEERCVFYNIKIMLDYINWLNRHHFDYRGLIKKGLAIEAPKDMYEIK